MTESSAAPDPRAPTRQRRHELVLWGGFGLCLLIALLTVVLPELSGADAANKKPGPAPAPAAAPAH